MSLRIVTGEIDSRDATTRVALPTSQLPRWPPFERVAETIATPRRPFPRHKHAGVEVLTYVIEGSATYVFDPATPTPLEAGSVMLLTAPETVSHAINPSRGHTVRWLSVVAKLPATVGGPARLQSGRLGSAEEQADGTAVRPVVGPGSGVTSVAGLEAVAIECREEGTTFQRVGHERLAVCYALAGHGKIDGQVLDGGEAGLVESAAGVAIQGMPGFRAALLSLPRSLGGDAPPKTP